MLKGNWSKAHPVLPRDHIKSHVLGKEKNSFRPSYQNKECPATISSLIGSEYARHWLEERDKFVQERRAKPKRFHNDYQSWLQKRLPRVNKDCKSRGVKKLLDETEKVII